MHCHWIFFMDRYAKSYLKEMELFIDALINNKNIPVGGYDGLQATLIAFAAKLSVEDAGDIDTALTYIDF